MNAMNYQATKNYQKIQVESASPAKLVLMLFDGAVKKLGLAEAAYRADRIEEYHEHVVRVQKIITELMGALDASKGGELAKNLERIYDYMLRQLSLALVRRNLEQIEEVKTLLEDLREGWKGVAEQNNTEEAIQEEVAKEPTAVQSSPSSDRRAAGYATTSVPVSSLNISG